MQQGGRGDDQDGAGLGFAGGSGRQQEAEVAVGDPIRLQDLAERVRPSWSTARLLGSSRWTRAGSGYPAHQDTGVAAMADQAEQERWRAQAAGRSRVRAVAAYRSMSVSDSTWS
jgi:hypothetical protein